MDLWWTCSTCRIPNDPKYSLCVNCGKEQFHQQPEQAQQHSSPPWSTRTTLSFSAVKASPSIFSGVSASPRDRGDASEEVKTFHSYTHNMSPHGGRMAAGGRSPFLGTSKSNYADETPSNARLTNNSVRDLIASILGGGTPAATTRTVASSSTAAVRTSSYSLSSQQPEHADVETREFSSLQRKYDAPASTAMDFSFREANAVVQERVSPPRHSGNGAVAFAVYPSETASSITKLTSTSSPTSSSPHDARRIAMLQQQLADSMLETQSVRTTMELALSSKEKEVAGLQHEVQRWKDEVLVLHREQQQLHGDLRHAEAEAAQHKVALQALHVEATRRVPPLVTEEFQLRMQTMLQARGDVMQMLGTSMRLLTMAVGDGVGKQHMTHSLEAATMVHSKTVSELKARVSSLEAQLLRRDQADQKER